MHTPEQQDELSRIVLQTGLEWGCPFVLYWELYNNEVNPDGAQLGYWLIDDTGAKQPIYFTYQEFYKQAREYVSGVISKTGKPPTSDEYRHEMVGILSNLRKSP